MRALWPIMILAATVSLPALGVEVALKASQISSGVDVETTKQHFDISGFAPAVAVTANHGNRLAFGLGLQPVINVGEKEVMRSGVTGIVEFMMLGHRRKTEWVHQNATFVARGEWAVSALLQTGIVYYQATVGEDDEKLKGSAMQVMSGVAGRYDVTDQHSVGLEALGTLMSLSNSSERLTAKERQFGAFYQFGF